jgi:RND family efflux transporter MFP subunit
VKIPGGLLSVLGIALVAGIGLVAFLASSSRPSYVFATVSRGTIIEEASASGKVEPPSLIELHFKNSGRLVSRSADVGETVEEGQVLARQDAAELVAQLEEVEAGVDVQKARLGQLLAGASGEDVRLAETAVENAQQSVADKKNALEKALQDAYTKADDAVRTKADVVFADPRAANPQINFIVSNQHVETNTELQRLSVESMLNAWNAALILSAYADLDATVADALNNLQKVTALLDLIAQALNAHVSGLSATTLDTWKLNISTARTTINAASAALISASEDIKDAKGVLASAQNALALKKAPARTEDIALYQAQIREAEARMGRIEAQVHDTRVVAPVAGLVTHTEGEVGEIVSSSESVVSLTPLGALQIKLNVSENNIANVRVGQKARITLDAFGNGVEWQGSVIAVDPAETIVGGAVYYQTTVLFDAEDERVKSGMTANAWIVTATHESALSVPSSALEMRDNLQFVRVRVRGSDSIEERVVQTGISGKGVVEILTGLSGGEEVVVGEGI